MGFLLGFISKKMMGKIAIIIIEKIIANSNTKLDDEYLKPVIEEIKKEFGL